MKYLKVIDERVSNANPNLVYKINEKINKENANEALEIYDTFLKRRTDPMPNLYIEIKNKIKELENGKEV